MFSFFPVTQSSRSTHIHTTKSQARFKIEIVCELDHAPKVYLFKALFFSFVKMGVAQLFISTVIVVLDQTVCSVQIRKKLFICVIKIYKQVRVFRQVLDWVRYCVIRHSRLADQSTGIYRVRRNGPVNFVVQL